MARRKLGFWRRVAVLIIKPSMLVLTKRTWLGFEHIPRTGPVIIVANHISHADPMAAAHYVYEAGRWPQFLAKSSLFDVPVMGWFIKQVRQIPVYRGTVDAAKALEAATEAVRSGGSLVIYPEGTTTKEPDLWPMRGKTGAARLALTTGAPVVPMVMWGPQRLFDPRVRKLRLRPGTPVTIVTGPPVDLSRWAGANPSSAVLNEMTEEIMLRIRDLLAEVRGEPAPPLWSPPARSVGSAATPGTTGPAGTADPAGTPDPAGTAGTADTPGTADQPEDAR